jgi:uncharacterized protein (UPF0212 family)
MTRCPECEAEIEADELDEFDVDIGDRLVCAACASHLEVVRVVPVELVVESEDATDRVKNWEKDGEWDT